MTTGYDEKTVKKNADEYGTQGHLLYLLHSVAPWVALGVGVLFVLFGLLLLRRYPPGQASAHRA